MNSLVVGEHYQTKMTSTLKRSCSLPKFNGNGLLHHHHHHSESYHPDEFVTVVEVDENLKQFNGHINPSMTMSTLSTASSSSSSSSSTVTASEPFVTVLEVGNNQSNHEVSRNINNNTINLNNNRLTVKTKTLMEEVTVYRLPGERLGMTLKFDGGANLDETIQNLYIQSINPESPASRISGSVLGRLCEGDELLEILHQPVNTMTRIECVATLRDAPVCFTMLIKRQETVTLPVETITSNSSSSSFSDLNVAVNGYHKATLRRVDSESVLTAPARTRRQPPPVPPRNSSTSLTSGSSFRSPIKPPARKRPSQPPPLPPRRSKDSGNSKLSEKSERTIRCDVTANLTSPNESNVNIVNINNAKNCVERNSFEGETIFEQSDPVSKTTTTIATTATATATTVNLELTSSQNNNKVPNIGTPHLNGCDQIKSAMCRFEVDSIKGKEHSICSKSKSLFQVEPMLPAPPELYMDTISPKTNLAIESDSDDTASSVSTVIDKFGSTSSFSLDSSPSSLASMSNVKSIQRAVSMSGNLDMNKILDPFEKLRREFDEKGSLEELIAEAKSGFSLDNIIQKECSEQYTSLPSSISLPPQIPPRIPAPSLPSHPPPSPPKYDVNLDDYDDIQSISMSYDINSRLFCEPIVEPPQSFSNTFPSIREESESSLDSDSLNHGKINKDSEVSDSVDITAADSVTLDAQEILSIVESMKIDEDLIPSIVDPVQSTPINMSPSNDNSVNQASIEKFDTVSDCRQSPLSSSSSSPSSPIEHQNKSSLSPATLSTTSSDGISGSDEDEPTRSSPLFKSTPLSSQNYSTNGETNGLLGQCNGQYSDFISNDKYNKSVNRSNSSASNTGSGSESSSYSSSSFSPCSPLSPPSYPNDRQGQVNRTAKNGRPIAPQLNSFIPKMIEPIRTSSSHSNGLLSRRSKSTMNLSFGAFDTKPSLIPRPISKPPSLGRSNSVISNVGHTNGQTNGNTISNSNGHSNKSAPNIRRSKSIENMRSLAFNSLASSFARRSGAVSTTLGRPIKSKEPMSSFSAMKESAKSIESSSHSNNKNYHHHHNNHHYHHHSHSNQVSNTKSTHQSLNGQSRTSSHSCNNRKQSSISRCSEKNMFNSEFTRSKSSLTASSLGFTTPSSLSSSSSTSSTSSSSSSSSGILKDQPLELQRPIEIKIDLSDDEKDDIKELEELEEFIAREMKCKESDDFLADELFSDSRILGLESNSVLTSSSSNISPSELDLDSGFNGSKIQAFPTIPEEQEDPISLEIINKESSELINEKSSDEQNQLTTNGTKHCFSSKEHLKKINESNGHYHQENSHDNQNHTDDSLAPQEDDDESSKKNTKSAKTKYIVFTKIIDL